MENYSHYSSSFTSQSKNIGDFFNTFQFQKMENRLNQRRVSFSDPQSQKHARDDEEHVAAIAATAFAIHSLEEAGLLDLKKMRESTKFSRNQTSMRGKEEKENKSTRQPSYGESSMKRSFGQETRKTESAFPVRRPSGVSPAAAAGYQKQQGSLILMHHKNDKAKAEAWEKAKIERIQKRYEKIKSNILSWESEKKIQAKIHMERKKSELDHIRAMEIQHYKNKIGRIDMIAQRAIAQLEDLRRKEESDVRENADKSEKQAGSLSNVSASSPYRIKSWNNLTLETKTARKYHVSKNFFLN